MSGHGNKKPTVAATIGFETYMLGTKQSQALISTFWPRLALFEAVADASLDFDAEDSVASLSLSPSRAAGLACWGGAEGGGAEPLGIELTDIFCVSLRLVSHYAQWPIRRLPQVEMQ
ncbi:hypothetical protein PHAMO_210007 [Magnetospirillum molischianum DSM 120]|uniref:Uncharacterized protein n=1 Tax=Magnetospirillum molischianum DSM 120 TaxID=1150626 RepID=H8FQ58_MAGML|nr:hypothetical protein PHAMO_210007 [Magnetospirillum molischianum DSM 120]